MGISLRLEGAEVSYGAALTLHGISLDVQPGEFFCLLGPSGCGKTTMLNVIAGFLPLRAGRVFLGGEDVTAMPPQRRKIGVVFQSYALYPHMNVEDNVGYGLKVQKRPPEAIRQRVAEMLALVQLTGKEKRYPRQLSGGEQQRVAIARALAIEPRLLLMDEPLSNLDARLRDEMRTELKRIQRAAGVTTIFVTHDQAEALGLGDRVAVINAGRIEQIGAPREIYRAPATPFVAGFVGRSNVIDGHVEPGGGGAVLRVGELRFDMEGPAWSRAGAVGLFLRPEELTLSRTPLSGNSVPGTIVDVVYGGLTVTCRVRTALGELEICQVGRPGLDPQNGEAVHVGWAAEAGCPMPEPAR
jgi:putative spermidine/putrescine transport system ATP-binding protein